MCERKRGEEGCVCVREREGRRDGGGTGCVCVRNEEYGEGERERDREEVWSV